MNAKKLTLTLSVVAAAGVLATGGAVAFAAAGSTQPAPAPVAVQNAASGDGKIVKECLDKTKDVPGGTWRPAAKFDGAGGDSFLMIRTDKLAAVCVVENGHGQGVLGGDFGGSHNYGKLTAARPFDYLTSMNYDHESVHFGIAAADVSGVSLVGPDKSVTGAVVKDGTFVVKTKWAEDSSVPASNHVRATLTTGQVIEGPFRG